MFGLLFKPKYAVFLSNHERLRSDPDPHRARERFGHLFKEAVRVNRVRIGAYALAYSGVIFAVTTLVLGQLTYVDTLERALRIVSGLTSSLTILAFGLILTCNRFLSVADVELHFLSAESRLGPMTRGS